LNEDLLKIEGFDEAVIGTCMTWHGSMLVERIVYDGTKLIELLMSDGEMTTEEEEANEYIDYNIIGAYVGDTTPIVMWPATAKELDENS
jgi:hypothetical protein